MIENQQVYIVYAADGEQREFEFPYTFSEEDDISLYIEHEGVLTEIAKPMYTFDPETKRVTYPKDTTADPIPEGDNVLLWRQTAITQLEDSSIQNFKSNDMERSLDKLTMICQELSDRLSRVISYNPTDYYGKETDATKIFDKLKEYADNAVATHNVDTTSHADLRARDEEIDAKVTVNANNISKNASDIAILQGTKQDNLTVAQLNAVNSGIDSTKVAQIATNTASIANEVANRQDADSLMQGQITSLSTSKQDALTSTQLEAVNSGVDSTKVSSYDSHIASTSNPHSVTKAQVGLGNADNTSDLNKPISTATQTALDAKASNADNASIVDNGTTITTVGVKEQNANAVIKKWVGTKAQLDAITTKDSNTEYTTTDENDGQPIVIDNALSSSSENPVQNKVIKAALDAKQATITGAVSNITSSNLTSSKALASDASGKVVASSVTATELGYVSGVTSAIQTQLNGKQPTLPAGTTGYYLKKTADGVTWADVPGGGGSVTVDGTTIDDTNDVLSAIGLKETRNSGVIKLWEGTAAQYSAINNKDDNTLYIVKDGPVAQTVSNLVTSVSSSSTDAQYPSAKLFYDTCGDIETLINAL